MSNKSRYSSSFPLKFRIVGYFINRCKDVGKGEEVAIFIIVADLCVLSRPQILINLINIPSNDGQLSTLSSKLSGIVTIIISSSKIKHKNFFN